MDASTNVSANEIVVEKKEFGLSLNPVMFALVHLAIILLVSLVVWNMFADPKQAILALKPGVFDAVLFWFIMEVVFFVFMLEFWPFTRLKQPLMGLAVFLASAVSAFLTVSILVYGVGRYVPAFDPNGMGWTAAGMIVLMGFYFYGCLTNSMGHWPWVDLGLKQPVVAIIEFFEGFFLCFIGYQVLIYPTVSGSTKIIMSLPTAVGWFYSVILVWLTISNGLGGWPWNLLGSRAKTAVGAFFGNFILGTGAYYLLLALLKGILIPAEAQKIIGAGITMWPAQLGVCIVFWVLTWSIVIDNNPIDTISRRVSRIVITYGLGLVTFLGFTRGFAVSVLHEAEVIKGFGGNPLSFVDLLVLVMLIFAIYFGSYGLNRKPK